MPATKVKEFLDANKIRYSTLAHSKAYTAQEIASLAHVRGRELAKTVMVKLDGRMAMAVLPASLQVDLSALKAAARVRNATLAKEEEFRDLFPACEMGAMPPFGNLYDLPVFAEASLARNKEIAFNAGTLTELIRMSYSDFVGLVKPVVVEFAARVAA